MLTMRNFFKEVQLGFLQLVIHMKTLTDALGICQKLKEKNKYILANLMKAFVVLHERPFIP